MKTIAAIMMTKMIAKKWVKIRRKMTTMTEMKKWRILQKKINKVQRKRAMMMIKKVRKQKTIHVFPFISRAKNMISK